MTHPTPTAAKSASPPTGREGMGAGCPPGIIQTTHPLAALEHTLWRTETRHDRALMEATFAPDFREFGRSGRRYSRDELQPAGQAHPIDATLHALKITDLTDTVALVTYISELRGAAQTEWANRASIWHKTSGHWQIRFYRGTPCEAPT